MLTESKLHSFYDEKEGFVLHFLEGQKLIHDLAIISNVQGHGLRYFRDTVLSYQPIIAFLKPSEGLGVYIDNSEPYFRFKMETNANGHMRALLLPEDLGTFPEKLNGVCRLTKVFGAMGKAPYTSILELHSLPCQDLANLILKDTYQMLGRVYVSEDSDQSILVLKLPAINVDKVELEKRLSINDYWEKKSPGLKGLFQKGLSDPEEIKKEMLALGTTYLRSKDVGFKCACSRDRMLQGLLGLMRSGETLFEEGKSSLETKCDYCKTYYQFTKKDLLESSQLN